MSTSQEGPALIQYACERCKTRFVLPPSSRQLSIPGKFRAFSIGLGRFFRHHEGVGAGYDTARRQLLAKMDDEAYQSFVQSFRFCHECRQFVCNECWSTSRRSCLTCVAKSMTGAARPRPPFAPTGPEIPRPVVSAVVPRRGRLRRDVGLVAMAIAIVLLSVEGGYLLVATTSGPGPTPVTIVVTLAPSASPSLVASATATPTAITTPTAMGSPTATARPTATRSASPSAIATRAQQITPAPTKAPVITPAPTAPPVITPAPTAPPVITPAPTAPPVIAPAPTAPPAPTTPPVPIIACDSGPVSLASGSINCSVSGVQWGAVTWWLQGRWGYNPVAPLYTSSTWPDQGGAGTYAVWVEEISGSFDLTSAVATFVVTP